MPCVCAEHLGHAAHAGNHSILWGGADAYEARLACWRHCGTGGVVCRRTWHELLFLCSASGHLRHLVLSHRQCVQSADHFGQPAYVG